MTQDFEGDAFISYAHLDNAELVQGRPGWVANLHRALEVRVGQLLGKAPHIWRDLKLSGNDLFAEKLIEQLRQVAALVTVVSPRYLKSEWTIREFKEFWAAAQAQGGVRVGDKVRVFKVLKTPVPLDRMPPELRTLLGYEFFKVDLETGKVRELDEVFGSEAHREFWIKLDDLAHDMVALLETLHDDESARMQAVAELQAIAAAPRPRGGTSAVYLAETTSDLREQRERLRRDLLEHGHTVLPASPIPLIADEADALIRESLARCRMSIHLVGRSYGVVPEGGKLSLFEMQHELATARAADHEFMRLLWMPDRQQVSDERQVAVIDRLRHDPRIQDRADLLETKFEDLRTTVQDWLTRERKPAKAAPQSAAAAVPTLYIIADPRDDQLITPWADALYDLNVEVIRPLFDGNESEIREHHEEMLRECDGVLMFYGAGNELWLQRKLRELQKAPGFGRRKPPPATGVCLVGPRTPAKERFRSHAAQVIPQWDGVAIGALREFVAQLKADRSA